MKALILSIILSVVSLNAAAQESFLSRLQGKTPGQGTVVVHQSAEITDLVSGKTRVAQNSASPKTASSTDASASSKNVDKPMSAKTEKSESTDDAVESNSTTHTKHVVKNRVKSHGYRIQVYAGGNSRNSRQEAQKMASRVKSYFPELPVYTHFYNPRWICRVGDFKTYEEAHAVLRQMREIGCFKEALIIKGQILISL